MARFANPALRHRTAHITRVSLQKLPPRLLERCATGWTGACPSPGRRWLPQPGCSTSSPAPEVRDPFAAELARAAGAGGPAALLDVAAVFGGLAAWPDARGAVLAALARLRRAGPRRTLGRLGDARMGDD